MYYPKKIYKFFNDIWVRHIHIYKELKESSDLENKKYIRASRNRNNLPNTYNTQWIKKIKNWKHRSKKQHQYEKHKLSKGELNYYYNYMDDQQELLFILSKLKEDEWYEVETEDQKVLTCYYNAAKALYESGIVDGECIELSWEFNYFGTTEIYKQNILLRIRMFKN